MNTARVGEAPRIEVEENITNVKYIFEQLGESQDDLLEEMGENHADLAVCGEWYWKYDRNLNAEVTTPRKYLDGLELENSRKMLVKIKKLNV